MNELKKNNMPIIIVLAILVVGLTIGLVLALTNNNDSDNATNKILASNNGVNDDTGNSSIENFIFANSDELEPCEHDGSRMESGDKVDDSSISTNFSYKCKYNTNDRLLEQHTYSLHDTKHYKKGLYEVKKYGYYAGLGPVEDKAELRAIYYFNADGDFGHRVPPVTNDPHEVNEWGYDADGFFYTFVY